MDHSSSSISGEFSANSDNASAAAPHAPRPASHRSVSTATKSAALEDLKDALLADEAPEKPSQPYTWPGNWALRLSRPSLLPLFNTICTMAGTGILQLPFTLKQSGWVGLVIMVVCCCMANYTGKAVIRCMYAGDRVPCYPSIGEKAFGKPGRYLVQVFHKATLMGVCTLFLILCGKFLSEVVPETWESAPTQRQWIWIAAAVVVLPVALLKTLHEIAALSMLGMLASIGVVGAVVVSALFYGSPPGIHHDVVRWDLMPTAFSAIVVSFGGHAVFPSIEDASRKRTEYPAVLNSSFLTILLVLYLPVSIAGYWVYGSDTFSPILCNLPRTGALAIAVKSVITFHVLTAYPILMNVLNIELENALGLDKMSRCAEMRIRIPLRVLLVAVTGVIAYFVPYFSDVMTFLGAACITALVFVLPVVFLWRLYWQQLGRWEVAFGVAVMVVGLAGGGIGIVQSLSSLIHKISNNVSPSAGQGH